MKRYAVTYAVDYDWNTVDTFILETDTCPLDMDTEDLARMFNKYIDDKEEAERIATYSDKWFCLDLDYKPDVVIKIGKER